MKVILSRKGFDSKYGGGPSPIIDGVRLVSLPIPERLNKRRRYRDYQLDGVSLGKLIATLHPKISPSEYCHFDPDLRRDALPHRAKSISWRPLFGQVSSAAKHLINQGVGKGDLFLFFGLFRESDGWTRFRRGAAEKHVLWGWFQVDEVVLDPITWAKHPRRKWASDHPHITGDWWRGINVLFIAKDTLDTSGLGLTSRVKIPGAGIFSRFDPSLCLSDPQYKRRKSCWKLPACFKPNLKEGRNITYISQGAWSDGPDPSFVHLNPGKTSLWQEAVVSGNRDVARWAVNLVRRHAARE